ncbi:MAG TPA: TAXI family TRAP transporter solute-binding subunit [Burkholderiales bacterium]|jgi:TRAP-type uncharacterized transport system substrate-binding protein|nr:TAXI family TRAP transporter solute-binding subunit [Burkholderiales bacterium]
MKPRSAIKRILPQRFRARVVGVSWRDLTLSALPIVLLVVVVIWAALHFNHPAPPDTIIISSGPEGSSFSLNAQRYAKILARNGVKLQILPSQGSLENLQRLNDPKFKVDIGFVQGGVASPQDTENLVSLGSLFYVPLMVFYRDKKPSDKLSAFTGKRVAIGPEGSGTRALALTLLKGNGIVTGGKTQLLELSGEEAADSLLAGKIDAVLLMGDSATPPIMRKLLTTPNVRLLNFSQADAYTRRYPYLSKLEMPMGSFDIGKNLPAEDYSLIGPTVEMIARPTLAPALNDLLIEAAREVHGRAGLLQKAGEFPAPLEHEFRISDDATRYYQSGKGFLYRNLPFWLANLINRVALVVVPLVVLLVPGLRMVPVLYSWRIRSRIYRWYGSLITIERSAMSEPGDDERGRLLKRLDEIENAVNQMKVPLAYADQFYVLRQHIGFVRDRLVPGGADSPAPGAPTASPGEDVTAQAA